MVNGARSIMDILCITSIYQWILAITKAKTSFQNLARGWRSKTLEPQIWIHEC